MTLREPTEINPGEQVPPRVTIEEVASGEWGIGGEALRTGDGVGMRAAVQ